MPEIRVTKADLAPLKRAYKAAVKANKYFFVFKGQEVITDYAKYLIEYLESLKL